MIIFTRKTWTRRDVIVDSNRIYIFGDNAAGYGTKGQACIRGLPNTIGIITKKSPQRYYSPDDLKEFSKVNRERWLQLVEHLDLKHDVVIHLNLGMGLASLDSKAPEIFKTLWKTIFQYASQYGCTYE